MKERKAAGVPQVLPDDKVYYEDWEKHGRQSLEIQERSNEQSASSKMVASDDAAVNSSANSSRFNGSLDDPMFKDSLEKLNEPGDPGQFQLLEPVSEDDEDDQLEWEDYDLEQADEDTNVTIALLNSDYETKKAEPLMQQARLEEYFPTP